MASTPDFLSNRHIDITIVEAELVRIFDSLKPTQDVFVQLACGFTDGTEQVVGRTDACKNGNLRPQWNERFNWDFDGSTGGRTLKFAVQIGHTVRKEVLCGEAEFDLATLCNKAVAGPQDLRIPLFKRDEQTGRLRVIFALGEGPASQPMSHDGATPTALQSTGSSPPRGRGWLGACGMVTPIAEPQPQRRFGDSASSSQLGGSATMGRAEGQSSRGGLGCMGGTPVSEPQERRAPPREPTATAAGREVGVLKAGEATPASPADRDPPAARQGASPDSRAPSSNQAMSEGAAERNVEFWNSFIERG